MSFTPAGNTTSPSPIFGEEKGFEHVVEHKEHGDFHHLTLTATLTEQVSTRMTLLSLWIAFGGLLAYFDLGDTGIV